MTDPQLSSVQDHYNQHLGPSYAWSVGGVESAMTRGESELEMLDISPTNGRLAVDLGAGFGMHAIPLARRGFDVIALDTCPILLDELRTSQGDDSIMTIESDLQSFREYLPEDPELIICMGDTIAHLPDPRKVEYLIADAAAALRPGGQFIVTFRDSSAIPPGDKQFIPVRSDERRILTCLVEHGNDRLTVHDIFHHWNGASWQMEVSIYGKVRLSPQWLAERFSAHGFAVDTISLPSGMVCLSGRLTGAI